VNNPLQALLKTGGTIYEVQIPRIHRTKQMGRGDGGRTRNDGREIDLLSYLAAQANRVITYRELLEQVWGSESGGEKESLRVFINRLRRKIEHSPGHPQYLLTQHSLGYQLCLRTRRPHTR
jgi:DNA-binding response OmpR family regulator